VASGTWRSRKPRTRFPFPPSLSSPAGFLGSGFPETTPVSSTARTEQRRHAQVIRALRARRRVSRQSGKNHQRYPPNNFSFSPEGIATDQVPNFPWSTSPPSWRGSTRIRICLLSGSQRRKARV
jgi:hypothetical protein